MAEDRINKTTSEDQPESGNEAREERGGKTGEPQEKARPDSGVDKEASQKRAVGEQDTKLGEEKDKRAGEEKDKRAGEERTKKPQ